MIVVYAMAASPEFHECCHEHSQDPSHECAVDLILQGGCTEVRPDIVPVDLTSGPPLLVVFSPMRNLSEVTHLVCGVLADSPPRGP